MSQSKRIHFDPVEHPKANNSPADDVRLTQAMTEYLEALEAGHRPDRDALLARHPEFAEELAASLDGIDFIQHVAPQLHQRMGEGDGRTSRIRSKVNLGDYQIVREIGRGGMGVVYEATQLSLGRRVALKVLPFAAVMDHKQLQRFKNEAQAAAQLHHQNIVPVYAVGNERGVHYYAMQYVEGQTVAEVITQLRQISGLDEGIGESGTGSLDVFEQLASGRFAPLKPVAGVDEPGVSHTHDGSAGSKSAVSAADTSPVGAISTEGSTKSPAFFRTVANLGIQSAEALEHAHDQGVIHRDIKPSNLLFDAQGKVWITDFGLARVEADAGLTMSGDLLGTVRYMSPEQSLAKRIVVDHRTDIYSLGATLYELLTLEPVFSGRDRQELLRQIAFEDPRPPRRLNKSIPAELETIVLKAMAKNPADRFATAQELADDLKRFLEDKPIKAKRPSLVQRATKWSRRHKPLVTSISAAALVMLVAISVGSWLWAAQQRHLVKTEQAARLDAESAGKDKARLLARRHMAYAQLLCERGEIGSGMLWLGRILEIAPVDAADLRRAARANLAAWRPHLRSLRMVLHHESNVLAVAFSPDDTRIVTGTHDGIAQFWDADSGQPIGEPMNHESRVHFVAFSPDGSHLLTGSRASSTVRVWNTNTCQPVGQLLQHAEDMGAATFSLDGLRILTGSFQEIRHWDAVTGNPLGQVRSIDSRRTLAAAFSPDSTTFVTGSNDGISRLWDTATGRLIRKLEVGFPFFSVRGLVFSTDGLRVVGGAGTLGIWDIQTGALISQSIRKPGSGATAVFNPAGTRLLTAGDADGAAWLWDVTSGTTLGEPVRHQAAVSAIAFNGDGTQMLTGGLDHVVRVWDMPMLGPTGGPMLHKQQIRDVAFSPDGLFIVTGCDDGMGQIWDATTSKPIGQALRLGEGGGVWDVAFSPDGSMVSTEGQLWETDTGKSVGELESQAWVRASAFSPDGSRIVTGNTWGVAQIWNVVTRQPIGETMVHEETVSSAAFSPDGSRVLTGSFDSTARIWDARTGKPIGEPFQCQSMVKSVAFSPDGTRFVTGLADGTVRLWDVATQEPIGAPLRHQRGMRSVAFSPNGLCVLTGALDGTARLWDVETGSQIGPPIEPGSSVYAVAFSPDGSQVLVGDTDGVAQLWQAPPPPVEGEVEHLVRWIQVITGRELESNGTEVVLDGAAWHERRERLERLGGSPGGNETVRLKPSVATQHDALLQHWREAGRCKQKEKWSDVLEHLDFLINAEPARSMHLLDRARAYAELGRWDNAAADIAKAMQMGADGRWIKVFLAAVRNSGRFEEAEKPYEEILSVWETLAGQFPDRAAYLNARAHAYAAFGHSEKAAAEFAAATRLIANDEATIAQLDQIEGPFVDYKVQITSPGEYQLYVRWGSHDIRSDSFYARIVELFDDSGGLISDWYRYSGVGAETIRDADFATFPWQGVAGFERMNRSGANRAATWPILSPGEYTVRFLMRKPGTAIDAFALQRADLPAPTGKGPEESSRTPENLFVESHGQVVVEAEHFCFRSPSGENRWLVVPDEAPGAEAHRNFRGAGYVQVVSDGAAR